MSTFTHSDLRTAGLILACKHRTCRITGQPWYTAEFIQWAKDVFAAFSRAAWTWVKGLGCSLKAAWSRIITAGKAVTHRIATTVRVLAENIRGKDLRAGRLTRTVHQSPEMRVRSKDRRRQQRWDQADRMQNSRQRTWMRNPWA